MLTKINKGLHIPLLGTPASNVDSGKSVKSVAVLGRDYIGLRPKMMVEVYAVSAYGTDLVLV